MKLLGMDARRVVILSGTVILLTLISSGRTLGQQTKEVLPDQLVQIERPIQLQQMNIGDICRLKGQERNTLTGMGIVTGLNGTGDGTFGPTILSLIGVMQKMQVPLSSGSKADGDKSPLANLNPKNVALVVVTADVPVEGARQGDEVDCSVSALNAKSLAGGSLMITPLIGPVPPSENGPGPLVYALAQGLVRFDDKSMLTTGKISVGCRFERSIMNPFVKDNKITLVINRNHASFSVAEEIETAINTSEVFKGGSGAGIAKAIDQLTVEVTILEQYRANPVQFASLILQQQLRDLPRDSIVVVNETNGVITMSADLELAPSLVTHQNMTIDIGNGVGAAQFVGLDLAENTSVPTLKALVQSMNALRVSAKDMIQIIRELDNSGAIYGHVIYR
ncbi:MAG: flagellar basal body P-ring protein FlgI [Pirellulaceae bacterium]